ncbi:MAG: hypothetical protein HYV09_31705 [Deltaproteobacteria bacterium]|nr:hypothetical protein [Deltaproteobacteria bacterium]
MKRTRSGGHALEPDEKDGRWIIEERRTIARTEGIERFDRVAFALRVLEILQKRQGAHRGMTVAVYQGRFELQVERGRDWGGPPGATWAMIAVPPDATRERIVLALAELCGVPATPWLLDTLLSLRDLGARDAPSGLSRAAV